LGDVSRTCGEHSDEGHEEVSIGEYALTAEVYYSVSEHAPIGHICAHRCGQCALANAQITHYIRIRQKKNK
jgi:hypothetical protein